MKTQYACRIFCAFWLSDCQSTWQVPTLSVSGPKTSKWIVTSGQTSSEEDEWDAAVALEARPSRAEEPGSFTQFRHFHFLPLYLWTNNRTERWILTSKGLHVHREPHSHLVVHPAEAAQGTLETSWVTVLQTTVTLGPTVSQMSARFTWFAEATMWTRFEPARISSTSMSEGSLQNVSFTQRSLFMFRNSHGRRSWNLLNELSTFTRKYLSQLVTC